jgi:hypothetical protein
MSSICTGVPNRVLHWLFLARWVRTWCSAFSPLGCLERFWWQQPWGFCFTCLLCLDCIPWVWLQLACCNFEIGNRSLLKRIYFPFSLLFCRVYWFWLFHSLVIFFAWFPEVLCLNLITTGGGLLSLGPWLLPLRVGSLTENVVLI